MAAQPESSAALRGQHQAIDEKLGVGAARIVDEDVERAFGHSPLPLVGEKVRCVGHPDRAHFVLGRVDRFLDAFGRQVQHEPQRARASAERHAAPQPLRIVNSGDRADEAAVQLFRRNRRVSQRIGRCASRDALGKRRDGQRRVCAQRCGDN